MLLPCNKCLKMNAAKLDVEKHVVMCSECGEEMTSITETMKRVLKSSGQIIRDDGQKAFVMACRSCNVNRQVVLDENEKAVCKICLNPINVHASMLLAIKEAGLRLKGQKKPSKKVAKKARGRRPKTTSNE